MNPSKSSTSSSMSSFWFRKFYIVSGVNYFFYAYGNSRKEIFSMVEWPLDSGLIDILSSNLLLELFQLNWEIFPSLSSISGIKTLRDFYYEDLFLVSLMTTLYLVSLISRGFSFLVSKFFRGTRGLLFLLAGNLWDFNCLK